MDNLAPALLFVLIDVVAIAGLTWMTWASMTGRLGIDGVGGFRTASTTASASAWRAGHQAVWPLVRVVVAVMIALVVLGLWLLSTGDRSMAAIALQAPILVCAVAVFPMIRAASRGAEEADRRPPR